MNDSQQSVPNPTLISTPMSSAVLPDDLSEWEVVSMILDRSRRAILRRLDTSLVIVESNGVWRVDAIIGGRLTDCRYLYHLPQHILSAIGGRAQ